MNNTTIDPKLANCHPQMVMTTLYIVFGVTYYLELQNAKYFTINVIFYQVKMSMFCTIQTTNLIFVGQKWDIQ